MEKRTHPITILEFVSKYLFLLLIPVLRGLFYLLTTSHDFYNWLAGAWVDLLVVLFILLASYLRWRFQFYRYDEQGLTVRRGVLIRRTVTIPQSSISTLTVEESFYLRPFRAVHLLADTDAGPFQRADCQLTLHREDACGLLERHGREPNLKPRLYRPRWTELAFLSIIVSNTLTGVVFLATFINKAGELLGEEFQRRLLVGLEGVAGLLAFLPQTGAVLALILMGGWLVGCAEFCSLHPFHRPAGGRRPDDPQRLADEADLFLPCRRGELSRLPAEHPHPYDGPVHGFRAVCRIWKRRGAGCAGAGCGHPFLPPDDADAAAGNGRPAPADPSALRFGDPLRYVPLLGMSAGTGRSCGSLPLVPGLAAADRVPRADAGSAVCLAADPADH